MKPTGQIELAFETGLMFYFGYSVGDDELQDSFRESLTLRVVVQVHSLLFLDSQIQNEHSMDNLLKVLMLLLVRVLLKPSFLRQHKAYSDQYPLAPTSISRSSTDHPLESIVAFKAKYLLIFVLYYDSMFSSQEHGNSMSIIFLKSFILAEIK